MIGFILRLLYNLLLLPFLWALFLVRRTILLRKPRVVALSLQSLPELSPSSLPFGERLMLDDWATQMSKAAQNSKISGLFVHIDGAEGGLAEMADITAQIAKFREAGKPVFVHIENPDNANYLAGCVATRLSVSRGGPVLVHSLGSEARYFGDVLQKVGIQLQVVRRRDHKTAMEPFQRNEPSAEQIETVHRLMSSVQKTVVEVIAAGRGRPAEEIQTLLDKGPFTLQQALDEQVIDAVETKESATLALLYACTPPAADAKQPTAPVAETPPAEGPNRGVVAPPAPPMLLPLMAAPLVRPRHAPLFATPTIAILPVTGLILDQPPSGFRPGKAAVASILAERLKALAEIRSVKAILLMIDSRGGSVAGSERLWAAVTETMREKPVIAWLRSFAASGGYYVASAAEHIVASPFTLTGSIGVIAGRPNVVQLAERLGVTSHYYGNARAGLFTSTLRALSDPEVAWLDKEIDEAYERFKQVVAMGRRLDLNRVEEIAGGRVWTGTEAHEIGLVDTLGMFEAAHAVACQLGGIRDPGKAALAWAGPSGSLLERVLSMRGGQNALSAIPPVVTDIMSAYTLFATSPIAYLYQPDVNE